MNVGSNTGGDVTRLTMVGTPVPGETNTLGEYTFAPKICDTNTAGILPALPNDGYADIVLQTGPDSNMWINGKTLQLKDSKGKSAPIPAIGQQVELTLSTGQVITGTVKYSDNDK